MNHSFSRTVENAFYLSISNLEFGSGPAKKDPESSLSVSSMLSTTLYLDSLARFYTDDVAMQELLLVAGARPLVSAASGPRWREPAM
jgi:hypothetical protein